MNKERMKRIFGGQILTFAEIGKIVVQWFKHKQELTLEQYLENNLTDVIVSTNQVTFNSLRQANLEKLQRLRVHQLKPGIDLESWTPEHWFQMIMGKCGEHAISQARLKRGDIDGHDFKCVAENELADIAIYLDTLCWKLDIDLGQAIVEKFNNESIQIIGSKVRLL